MRQLYERTRTGVRLTEHGTLLARHAQSICDMTAKAIEEVSLPPATVEGPVHIAAGETRLMGVLAQAMVRVRKEYPGITFELYSGTTSDLMDGFTRGRYDFLLECELQYRDNVNALVLPERDVWGIVARKDSALGSRELITPDSLVGVDIIGSRQGIGLGLRRWAGECFDRFSLVGCYDLPRNAEFLVREGLGVMFIYEGLPEPDESSDLRFIPLHPRLESTQGLIWHKTLPTKQAQVFLDAMRQIVGEGADRPLPGALDD